MAILVIAEHDNFTLHDATLNAINAGLQLGDDIHLLIIGYQCKSVIDEVLNSAMVNHILVADYEQYAQPLAEELSILIANIAISYSHIIAASTTFAKNILPRVAALLDVSMLTDVVEIKSDNLFLKPIYSGHVIATIQSVDEIKVMTIRMTAFIPASARGCVATISTVPCGEKLAISQVIDNKIIETNRPNLSSADIVIGVGRGIGDKATFKVAEILADKIKAAIGGTRAGVDAGFIDSNEQIGQTGKFIAPSLYIALGISGAIQHVSGIKDSKIIVAINNDPEAHIFKTADYILVGDCAEVLSELTAAL